MGDHFALHCVWTSLRFAAESETSLPLLFFTSLFISLWCHVLMDVELTWKLHTVFWRSLRVTSASMGNSFSHFLLKLRIGEKEAIKLQFSERFAAEKSRLLNWIQLPTTRSSKGGTSGFSHRGIGARPHFPLLRNSDPNFSATSRLRSAGFEMTSFVNFDNCWYLNQLHQRVQCLGGLLYTSEE